MTKASSTQPSSSKSLREGRNAKGGGTPSIDACDLFLAELASRRERLQQLLTLVHQEARRLEAARAPRHPHHTCAGKRRKSDF